MSGRTRAITTAVRIILTAALIVWVALGSRVALVVTLALICAAIEAAAWAKWMESRG